MSHLGGVLVRSKNEVIVASILEDLAPTRWSYERPLTIDGVTKYPDFTIQTSGGDEILWEHLGMMGNPRYAADWAVKKAWYVANGFRPYDEPDTAGSRGVLIWTDDRGGVDQPVWADIARHVIGASVSRRSAKRRPEGGHNPVLVGAIGTDSRARDLHKARWANGLRC